MKAPRRRVVVFDLGGVLLEWNPRHLYRKLFAGDDAAMEAFLGSVCTEAWNERQDAGRSFADGVAELLPKYPQHARLIEAFGARFGEMIPGAIEDSVAVLHELKRAGVPVYALTNWSSETFPPQRQRFAFLALFDGIVVSGDEGVIKPDPRIFRILLERYGIAPGDAVFIDDVPANAAAAATLGIHGIHFRSPALLRAELATLGLLPAMAPLEADARRNH
jgi:2-haloacid dehalogenase